MLRAAKYFSLIALSILGACTTVPTGPSVMALPGGGKDFNQFRADDYDCRNYAGAQVGGTTAQNAATESGVNSAAVGTLLGAAAGAAIGGGHGAGVGAGTGLVTGGLLGTGAAQSSAYALQQRYDIAYVQCMYAKGHQVPVAGRLATRRPPVASMVAPPLPPPPETPPPSMPRPQ